MKNKKMLIFILILVIIGGIVLFITRDTSINEPEYSKITAKEAKEIIDSNENVIILDVRTEEEYNSGHIEGAVNIPNESISKQNIDVLPDKENEILIYCRSGNRSKQAAYKLLDLGYLNIKDFGGIIDWPYKVIN